LRFKPGNLSHPGPVFNSLYKTIFMFLEKLHLLNFKNHEDFEAVFSPQINCFVGENGSGKTNLLDAIYYLCLTKSAFSQTDNQGIRHGADFFLIDGTFEKNQEHFNVKCSLKLGGRKVFQINKVAYEKISDHIGRFPLVLMAPDDTDLVKDGSEERRKFFDGLISQLDHNYLEDFIQYTLVLRQRNSLLKQFFEKNYFDKDLLEVYTNQLLQTGQRLHTRRKQFIETFVPVFRHHYQHLSESREDVDLIYESELFDENFEYDFSYNFRRDLQLQRTTKGIHKDDFVFEINKFSLRKYGSQGQQKSFVIALKLAQFEVIKNQTGIKPLLVLDDIFDKLDERRIARLMQMIAESHFGQIFVTDARPERTRTIFGNIEADKKIFQIAP
jgi:DNA replication and repair protein RecF